MQVGRNGHDFEDIPRILYRAIYNLSLVSNTHEELKRAAFGPSGYHEHRYPLEDYHIHRIMNLMKPLQQISLLTGPS